MGSELVTASFPEKDAHTVSSYTDEFFRLLPFYLSVGMSAQDFWNGDCLLAKSYYSAYRLRRERENESMWIQGMYIYEALYDVSPVLHAFPERDARPLDYPSRPYPITEEEVKRRREEKEKADYERIKAQTTAFMIGFNAKFKGEQNE